MLYQNPINKYEDKPTSSHPMNNCKKLLENMNYRITEKNDEVFFKYNPKKNNKKIFDKKSKKESPFGVLKNISFN